MSASVGLPAYDAALLATEEAVAAAERVLDGLHQMDDETALETCARIARAFDAAERGWAAIRMRAERNGVKLYRARLREAREVLGEPRP